MRFPGAGPADQHDVLGGIEEAALVQLADRSLVDLAGGEVEAGEILVGREARGLHVVGDGADLAFGQFGLEQLGQDRHGGFKSWRSLFHEFRHSLGHTVHFEAAQHDDDGAAGEVMTHGGLP
jgi:hypothetical protein